jgi:hypothetical protein
VVLIHDSEPIATAPPVTLVPPSDVWVPSRAQADLAHDWVVLATRFEQPGSQHDDSDTLGIVLLIVALAVLVSATLYWSGRVALDR